MNTHESYVVPGTGMFWGYLQALPKDYDPNGSYPLAWSLWSDRCDC